MTVPDPVHTRKELDALLRTCTNYERMPAFHQGRVRVDLSRMWAILADCDHPERGPSTVHITGSKGKGSTATMCARILGTLGPVGLHTSPHLHRMEERVRIDGAPIGEGDLLDRTNELVAAVRRLGDSAAKPRDDGGFPTFFEYITLLAFLHFRARGVPFAVHEAGMGGRLDATNVCVPAATAVINVDLEHTAVLGDTTEAIAEEKGGILKAGAVFCTGEPRGSAARKVLDRLASAVGVTTLGLGEELQVQRSGGRANGGAGGWDIQTPNGRYLDLHPAILGDHQGGNLAIAIGLAEAAAAARDQVLDPDAVREALSGMTLPGRLERISSDPPVYLDGAHTAGSVRLAMAAVQESDRGRDVVVVFAMARDKDRAKVATALAQAHYVVTCAYDHPRASDPDDLLDAIERGGGTGESIGDPQKALARACELAEDNGLVLVMGSLYLVGAIRPPFAGR